MPMSCYHAGSALGVALLARGRVNLPTFVAASVAVDVVIPLWDLLGLDYTTPRYIHTLLWGGLVGVGVALALWPLRLPLGRLMHTLRLQSGGGKARCVVSGVLGAWLHVLTDGCYRMGAGLLWPLRVRNPMCRFDRDEVELACVVLTGVGLALWARLALTRRSMDA